MFSVLGALPARFRILITRVLVRLGLGEDAFLLVLAVLVGIVTSAAAVGFHELIQIIRNKLYLTPGEEALYGKWIILLILIPAAGGLAVGVFSRYIARTREGHGIIDVMESVMRSGGILRPITAIEKILTSAVTIGTGGSAGAEGPIVQIGASIASGFGQLFRIARPHMPVLVGCGTAAGISAIFNSPIGGVLFTLEVILLDFSIRTFTPVVLASVIANVTTQQIFYLIDHQYNSIFYVPPGTAAGELSWYTLPNFLLLGAACGIVGAVQIRLMYFAEKRFSALPIPRVIKPALGGAALGVLGVTYIIIFGWIMLDRPKPIDFENYPMPSFFGDGYGVVQQMLGPEFYGQFGIGHVLLLLTIICVCKIVGTCLTLASGGSGGIIAPSLFLGAVTGAILGTVLQAMQPTGGLEPATFALVGMGAVLAAVVHAPLAATLILFDVTTSSQIVLPAMLASVFATGVARLVFRDSIYTLSLRLRGVRLGSASDALLLQRLSVEQVDLEPATIVHRQDPLQKLVEMLDELSTADFVVVDQRGHYTGLVVGDDLKTAALQREAVPLLLVHELMRADVPIVQVTDDLASVLDLFTRHDVTRLPVCISRESGKVIGLVSRAALLKRYQKALAASR